MRTRISIPTQNFHGKREMVFLRQYKAEKGVNGPRGYDEAESQTRPSAKEGGSVSGATPTLRNPVSRMVIYLRVCSM